MLLVLVNKICENLEKSYKREIFCVSTHLDGREPVVDGGEGRVVGNVVGERVVHRTLRNLLQSFRTANLK